MPKTPPQPLPRLAFPPCLPTELLTYILAQQSYPTHLLVCNTRAAFISQLLKATTRPQEDTEPLPLSQAPSQRLHKDFDDDPEVASQASDVDNSDPSPEQVPAPVPPQCYLLTPTLAQILSSRHIHLSFLPTLSHLRAYLSVFSSKSPIEPTTKPLPHFDHLGIYPAPLLCVYGLVEAHLDTSEWSAQGLSCTIAALVEAGTRTRMRVVVVERRELGDPTEAERGRRTEPNANADADADKDAEMEETWVDGAGGENAMDDVIERTSTGGAGQEVWKQRMPLLNGSMRRHEGEATDYGSRGITWSGRSVEVGIVVRRWFRFEDID